MMATCLPLCETHADTSNVHMHKAQHTALSKSEEQMSTDQRQRNVGRSHDPAVRGKRAKNIPGRGGEKERRNNLREGKWKNDPRVCVCVCVGGGDVVTDTQELCQL